MAGLAQQSTSPLPARRYPNREQQALFWHSYMAQAAAIDSSSGSSAGQQQHQQPQAGLAALPPAPPVQLSDEVLDRLVAEANVYALASHLYWGVWALVQARYSTVDFDYMAFSRLRLGEFRRRKAEFIRAARKVFGSARYAGGLEA